MNIIFVGNSFSRDTIEHCGNIAKNLGLENFCIANLYIGGCSINRHFRNASENLAEYQYSQTTDGSWSEAEIVSIATALEKMPWDMVVIQHGTGDKSRYTSPESYVNLASLISYIRSRCKASVKIAFNMAWVGEPDRAHHEIVSYGGDTKLMYKNLTALTESIVLPLVDLVSPAGTAIQNLRTCLDKKITRDGFHLTKDLGRFTAGLTCLKTLLDLDLQKLTWFPEGVEEEELPLAVRAAEFAVENPYTVTDMK